MRFLASGQIFFHWSSFPRALKQICNTSNWLGCRLTVCCWSPVLQDAFDAPAASLQYIATIGKPCYLEMHFCSGMLIGPEWVFTAASCLQHFNFSAISVRFQVGEGLEVRQCTKCSSLQWVSSLVFAHQALWGSAHEPAGILDNRICGRSEDLLSLSLSLSPPLFFSPSSCSTCSTLTDK